MGNIMVVYHCENTPTRKKSKTRFPIILSGSYEVDIFIRVDWIICLFK